MNKQDIAKRIHQAAGISEEKAGPLLNSILEVVKSTLQQGKRVSIMNFGAFTVRSKASRNVRNPSTGQPMLITSRRVVIFHPSPRLKAEVNGVQAEPQDTAGLLPKGK